MAHLVIKDLTESVELDQQAMAAIAGGARIGARHGVATQWEQGAPKWPARAATRLVDYPPGFPSARQIAAEADATLATRHG
jgi:hypothetical protein